MPRPVPRYRFNDFILSPRRRLLIRAGRELPLIPRYFDLLVFLVERRHEAVHRRQIFDRVWGDVIVSDSALSQAIRTLRRTLGEDPDEARFIRTVSRHGYQFVCPDVFEEEEEDEDDVVRLGAAPWAGACAGGGLTGLAAGAAGGLLLAVSPGSVAPLGGIPVLAVIGGACGAIGGAGVGVGVGAGLSLSDRYPRIHRIAGIVGGAALGGAIVGSAVQWIARWGLASIVGVTLEIGGGVEGAVIGASAGLGYALALSRPRLHGIAVIAFLCGCGAFALAQTGRPLVGGTLHAIARHAQGSLMTLAPLGRWIGEPDFGPVSQMLVGTGEGALFGLGLAYGLLRRPSSPKPPQTPAAP